MWLVFWIVPAFYTAFGIIFFMLTRTMPPPRPDITTGEMVGWFRQHATTIRIGFAILLLIVGGAGVANGIVAYHMKRMTVGSVMAYTYIGAMAVGALPGCLLVAFCFLAATFRPDRDPELIALLYDLGLLSYVGSLGCFSAAYFAFAIAIFYDRNEIFPKWLAYISIWQIVTEIIADAGVHPQGGAVRMERFDLLLDGDGGLRYLADVRDHLPEEGHRAAAGRRTPAGLVESTIQLRFPLAGRHEVERSETIDKRTAMTDTDRAVTPERQRAPHLPGDIHIWVMVLGDLVIFGAYFLIFMIYRAMDAGRVPGRPTASGYHHRRGEHHCAAYQFVVRGTRCAGRPIR